METFIENLKVVGPIIGIIRIQVAVYSFRVHFKLYTVQCSGSKSYSVGGSAETFL